MNPEPTTKEIEKWMSYVTDVALSFIAKHKENSHVVKTALHIEKIKSRPRKRVCAQLNEWK